MTPAPARPHAPRGGRPQGHPPLSNSWSPARSTAHQAAACGGGPHFALPNSLRRTAAIFSHWMPSVGFSSFGQASTQLVMVWQR